MRRDRRFDHRRQLFVGFFAWLIQVALECVIQFPEVFGTPPRGGFRL